MAEYKVKLPGEPTRRAGRKNGSLGDDSGMRSASGDAKGVNQPLGRCPKADEEVLRVSPPLTRSRSNMKQKSLNLLGVPQLTRKTEQADVAPEQNHSGDGLPQPAKLKKSRYPPCPSCAKQVRDTSVQCALCKAWYHGKCAGFTKKEILEYARRKIEDMNWTCFKCVPDVDNIESEPDQTPVQAEDKHHVDPTKKYKEWISPNAHCDNGVYIPAASSASEYTVHIDPTKPCGAPSSHSTTHGDSSSYIPATSSAIYSRDRVSIPHMDPARWEKLDEELANQLQDCLYEKNIDQMVQQYDTILYNHVKKMSNKRHVPANVNKSAGLCESLRKRKKDMKRQWKNQKTPELRREWFRTMRLHCRVSRKLQEQDELIKVLNERKNYRQDPNGYAKKLLAGASSKSMPDEDELLTYYRSTYDDLERSKVYQCLDGVPPPEPPISQMNCGIPAFWELDTVCRRKRAGSAPGPNGISILIYKKCPKVLRLLYNIMVKIWQAGRPPKSWGQAKMVFIPKKEDAEKVTDYRPICITNVEARLFFSVFAKRLTKYCVTNRYVDPTVQKGFIPGTAGCLEHIEVLWNAFMDARTSRKSIYITWIDIKNAFGSVRHNLIQFALRRYFLPRKFIQFIFWYYETLAVMLRLEECNYWVRFRRGVFQGCPLSAPLFLLVYNIGLDLLKTDQEDKFAFSSGYSICAQKGFADDLALVSASKNGCQRRIHAFGKFLKWADMTPNVKKCNSVCMRRQKKKEGGSYIADHPGLTLYESTIPSLLETDCVKYLGKNFSSNPNNKAIIEGVVKEVKLWCEKVNNTKLTGPMKASILNSTIVAMLRWRFAVYDIPKVYLHRIDALFTSFYKRWLKLAQSATSSILYRSKNHFGIQLTKPSVLYMQSKISAIELLKRSKDPSVKEAARVKEKSTGWNKGSNVYEVMRTAKLEDSINNRWRRNVGRHGLGYAKSSNSSLSSVIKQLDEENMMAKLHTLSIQGAWLQWDEVMKLDISWQTLLKSYSPALLSFAINAVGDTLPNPSNLKRWGRKVTGACGLCHNDNCTLAHILNGCSIGLQQRRYTWRHDQVLARIEETIKPLVKRANRAVESFGKRTIFKTAHGIVKEFPEVLKKEKDTLGQASDWTMLTDMHNNQYVFPVTILETALRPDIIIYSNERKHIVILELTVPMEARIKESNVYKLHKYSSDLVPQIREKGWAVDFWPIEVGSRGAIGNSLRQALCNLGMRRQWLKSSLQKISKTALRASYVVSLNRKSPTFKCFDLVKRRNPDVNEVLPF